jgi:SAM-dependent methyltransferase
VYYGIRRFLSRLGWPLPAESLGAGLSPGDRHYRAYVGPPEDYDLIAAMTFNLLTTLGLRQYHAVLDIGCGSLRIGRLLIPYLNSGRYTGIEPNRWLVEEGIRRETGRNQVRIKRPQFIISSSPEDLPLGCFYDFAVAQSVFSHAGPDLISVWLRGVSSRLNHNGALVATFITSGEDFRETGWFYPACVGYRTETMAEMARDAGLRFLLLDWRHPRQSWALLGRPGFDTSWLSAGSLTWNALLDRPAGKPPEP